MTTQHGFTENLTWQRAKPDSILGSMGCIR